MSVNAVSAGNAQSLQYLSQLTSANAKKAGGHHHPKKAESDTESSSSASSALTTSGTSSLDLATLLGSKTSQNSSIASFLQAIGNK